VGKPVIFFVTEKEPMLKRPDIPRDLFAAGTTIARNPDELWELVECFFTEPGLAESMKLKAAKFARENLDDGEFPSLTDVIKPSLPSKTF